MLTDNLEIKTPMRWTNFLDTITEGELVQIIRDYELFNKQSYIGDCFLRSKAIEWEANIGFHSSTIMVMRDLAFHAYQHFASLYMAEHFLSND